MSRRTSAFTVDVEDGVSLGMRDYFGLESSQTNRVVRCTERILDMLERYEVKGTFFILGKVAEDFPDLVRRIAKSGHEIGVHGYNHLRFSRISPRVALEEIIRAKSLLEDLTGQEIDGHRAPAFSICPKTSWALDIIAESGFKYDSSIIPGHSEDRWPGFTKKMIDIRTSKGNNLTIVPMSTLRILQWEIPFGGGSYLRLFPLAFTKWAFKINSREIPNILYIHPYELDTERYPAYYFNELRKKNIFTQVKLKSMWIGRKSVLSKIEYLLKTYDFSTMLELITVAKINQELERIEIDTSRGLILK